MLQMDDRWRFEPCAPEDGVRQPDGKPYPHAVKGVRPTKSGRGIVVGVGRTEPLAGENARERALQFDAAEVLGAPSDPYPHWAELGSTVVTGAIRQTEQGTGFVGRWDGTAWRIG